MKITLEHVVALDHHRTQITRDHVVALDLHYNIITLEHTVVPKHHMKGDQGRLVTNLVEPTFASNSGSTILPSFVISFLIINFMSDVINVDWF